MTKWDNTFIEIAEKVANHSTCLKHQVGAVIVKNKRILSTGYNGVVAGAMHCEDLYLKKPMDWHHSWSVENEIHAEQNAIAYAAREGISIKDATIYVTLSPCLDCAKLIVASGIIKVVYGGPNRQEKIDDGIKFFKEYQKINPQFETLPIPYFPRFSCANKTL